MFERDGYGQLMLTRRGTRAAIVILAALLLAYGWLEGAVGLS